MFCETYCMPGNREEDRIIVDSEAVVLEEARREAEAQAARMEEERQRAEEEERRRLDELRGEQERLQRLAKAEAEERERKRQQEEEEARQKQEAERLERERHEQEYRKAALDEFFQRWGFDGVNLPKRGGGCSVLQVNVTYPLHKAAELKDHKIVRMLLQERADVNQTNSANMTPVQVAKKNNKGNSHSAVLRLLGADITPTSPKSGGA
mmetsp:Transcript_18667/g.36613  ORF Transcript_18667/g.36613 Transcript_18667/m.36613 type:complete len:209 (+) Transcript_18667:70-696(+)